MTKLRKDEEVALSALIKICEYLDCNIGDIPKAIQDFEEKKIHIIGDGNHAFKSIS